MNRLTVSESALWLRFRYAGVEIGGADNRETSPDDAAAAIVAEFHDEGVDASSEYASIVQAIRDHRQTYP